MTANCQRGDIAIVVRNTTGDPCMERELGRVIYCNLLDQDDGAPVWKLSRSELCQMCGSHRYGFLDADLQPIRPPGVESTALEVEYGVAHG